MVVQYKDSVWPRDIVEESLGPSSLLPDIGDISKRGGGPTGLKEGIEPGVSKQLRNAE